MRYFNSLIMIINNYINGHDMQIVKYRTELLNDRQADVQKTQYLAIVAKKYDALVLKEADPHIRVAQRALRTGNKNLN